MALRPNGQHHHSHGHVHGQGGHTGSHRMTARPRSVSRSSSSPSPPPASSSGGLLGRPQSPRFANIRDRDKRKSFTTASTVSGSQTSIHRGRTMSAGVHPPPKGLQMPAPPTPSDGFSTYGASASASSALDYSETENHENRYISLHGDDTEVERRMEYKRRDSSGTAGRSATPTAPGIERK